MFGFGGESKVVFAKSNFEEDFRFLTFLIRNELEIAKSRIYNEQLSKEFFVKDDYIKIIASDSAFNIIQSMSKQYKDLLLMYFNEEALIKFISQRILILLMELGLGMNTSKLTSGSTIVQQKSDI